MICRFESFNSIDFIGFYFGLVGILYEWNGFVVVDVVMLYVMGV